jgi:hypothetical protein
MSVLSEQGQINREDPIHYAPRWLREKPDQRIPVIEETRPAQTQSRRPEPPSRATASPLDAQLENAVYESLRRQLDPEIMEEPADLARELDRRDALFGVAGRFALAIGVSALVAVFFVFMIPASRQPDAGSSLSSTIEQMKAALKLTQPVSAPREDAVTTAAAPASPPPSSDADYQTIRTSSDVSPPVTHEQSEKLLQQFMRWRQKPATQGP